MYQEEERAILYQQKIKSEGEMKSLKQKKEELEKRIQWVMKEFHQTEIDLKRRIRDLEKTNSSRAIELQGQESLIEELSRDLENGSKDYDRMREIIKGLEHRLKENFEKFNRQLIEANNKFEREREDWKDHHWAELERLREENLLEKREEVRREKTQVLVKMQTLIQEKEKQNQELRKGITDLESKMGNVIEQNKLLEEEKVEREKNFIGNQEEKNKLEQRVEKDIQDLTDQNLDYQKKIEVLKSTLLKCEEEREKEANKVNIIESQMEQLKEVVMDPGDSEKRFMAEKLNLETNLEILRGKKGNLEDIVLTLTEQNQRLKMQNNKYCSEMENIGRLTLEEDIDRDFYDSERKRAEKSLREERSEKEKLEEKIRDLELEIEKNRLDYINREKERDNFSKQLEGKNQTIFGLERTLNKQKDKITRFEMQVQDFRRKVMMLEDKKSMRDVKIEQMEREKEKNRRSQQQLVNSLETKNGDLKRHLEEIQTLKERYFLTFENYGKPSKS